MAGLDLSPDQLRYSSNCSNWARANFTANANAVDVVLLGPQVRFQKPEIEAVAQGKMPVAVIEMKDYGTMNGQAVLEFAMKLLQE